MTSYSRMQEMKRAIYAMRNGVVADALRSARSPYRFIMGVNLPQLKEIEIGRASCRERVCLYV